MLSILNDGTALEICRENSIEYRMANLIANKPEE
jgi:hypothetical protein